GLASKNNRLTRIYATSHTLSDVERPPGTLQILPGLACQRLVDASPTVLRVAGRRQRTLCRPDAILREYLLAGGEPRAARVLQLSRVLNHANETAGCGAAGLETVIQFFTKLREALSLAPWRAFRAPLTSGWVPGRFPHALRAGALRQQHDYFLYIPV